MIMRSSSAVFRRMEKLESISGESATIQGVTSKSVILIGVTLLSAILSISLLRGLVGPLLLIITSIATFIIGIIISFSPTKARTLSIPYAIGQGLVLGVITAIYEGFYSGIAALALVVTMAIFLVATVLYTSGIVKVGTFFRRLMFTLLIGSLFVGLIIMIISLINPMFYQNTFGYDSPIAFGLSAIMVVISSLYVLISLDNANRIVTYGMDQVYEWYAGFGILINIIWLYLEVLRFLAIVLNRTRR
jgi:uncharacterized YccA/Bax inhibitor family protein